MFLTCLLVYIGVTFCQKLGTIISFHGRLQAWARGTPWKCCKVLFVLQMLSKVSVDLCIILRKCQLLGNLPPYFHRSSALLLHSGTSVLQTPSLPTPIKSCRRLCLLPLSFTSSLCSSLPSGNRTGEQVEYPKRVW